MTRYMPTELMFGQKPVIPIERAISSWVVVNWIDELSLEELLAAWI